MLAIFQNWESTKNHMGTASAAASLHLSSDKLREFVLRYNASLPDDQLESYDRPVQAPRTVHVSDALYERLVASGGSVRDEKLSFDASSGVDRVHELQLQEDDSFMDLLLKGKAKLSQVDDYVERWHARVPSFSVTLHDFLGLSVEEYRRFVANPQELLDIAFDRVLAKQAGGYFRHIKSGGDYLVLAHGKLEADGLHVAVYVGTDGQVWVRDKAEFLDGRFKPLAENDKHLALVT